MKNIDWSYIANKIIYISGYIFIIFLSYIFSNYYVTYSRRKKAKAASLNEKIWNYVFAFLIIAAVAFVFSINSKHRAEDYIIAFISLIAPSFLGLMNAYKIDKKLSDSKRLKINHEIEKQESHS